MKLTKYTFTKLILLLLSANILVFGQQEDEKKKIKVQLLVSGKPFPQNHILTKLDTSISVRIMPFETKDHQKKELVATNFAILLIHNGRKVAEENIKGSGSIAKLAEMAKNDDTFAIEIKEVFEKLKNGNLRTFTTGVFRLHYPFSEIK